MKTLLEWERQKFAVTYDMSNKSPTKTGRMWSRLSTGIHEKNNKVSFRPITVHSFGQARNQTLATQRNIKDDLINGQLTIRDEFNSRLNIRETKSSLGKNLRSQKYTVVLFLFHK